VRDAYPIEALLRPPVELWSAAIAGLAAAVALAAPWAFLMTPGVAWGAALLLGTLCALRAQQGLEVLRYQRNLRRLPLYRLRSRAIAVSSHKLFLGRGFRWTQRHAQRLRDTLAPEAARYLAPGALYRWARTREIAWEPVPLLCYCARALRSRAWWNPLRPLPALGGNPAIHGVEPNEQDVWMDLSERVGHMLVLGTTRVGKTRFAELLIAQDIRRGGCVIVFDPKGDPDLLRRVYAEARRAGRLDAFYLFHLGHPERSARYNAVGSFSRITEVATRIANQLPNQGNSAAFREFAWRFTNIIARALVALGRRPDYQGIARHITHIEPLLRDYCRQWLAQAPAARGWEAAVAARAAQLDERKLPFALKGRDPDVVALVQYLKEQGLYDPVADGLRSAFEYDKTYFDKIVASLLPLLEKLISGKTAELISPDYFDLSDPRPIFDWMAVIRRGGIVYVGLDALSDQTVASAVGNSMFADLVSVAGELYKHGADHGLPALERGHQGARGRLPRQAPAMISVHADEFNELIGEEFIPLLNKAGGAGFQVTAYTQTWSDVEARLGSRPKAGQVAGNFNTHVLLRVKELATAEMLTDQLPEVEIRTLMVVSQAQDSSDVGSKMHFTSNAQDRISTLRAPLLTPNDLVTLPKGQAFALIEGGQLWKLRLPLPDARDERALPAGLAAIAEDMARGYSTAEGWWRQPQAWLSAAAAGPDATAAPRGVRLAKTAAGGAMAGAIDDD